MPSVAENVKERFVKGLASKPFILFFLITNKISLKMNR